MTEVQVWRVQYEVYEFDAKKSRSRDTLQDNHRGKRLIVHKWFADYDKAVTETMILADQGALFVEGPESAVMELSKDGIAKYLNEHHAGEMCFEMARERRLYGECLKKWRLYKSTKKLLKPG